MKIINTLVDKVKQLDEKVKKIMSIGFRASFVICLLSAVTLFTYNYLYSLPDLYYAGMSLFHTSLMFGCTFFICGIGFDTIKKQIV